VIMTGIGFLVGNDICVIDLDDCFDSSGDKLKPVAQNVVEAFSGCYMEYSPSGKGLHIFFKATGFDFDKTKYYINNRKLGVEIYVSGATNRFVTITGNVYANGDIAEKSNELQMILDKYMLRPTPVKQILDRESQSYLSDKSVIKKALKSANGERFKALWQGDTSGYASASEADLALCGMLAFWCGRDIGQMDRLFRKSGLMRDKWNRPQSGSTYGMITIEKAIANATEIYKPGGKRSSATEDFGECSLTGFKPESNDRYPWTDIGASRLFADYYKSFARFVPERKMWFCYENGIWIPDVGNLKVMEMCKSLANQLLTYALTIQDEHQRKAYIDYCRKWQSRRYRETVLKDAQSVYPISMAEFDQGPLMLNCANGTLFLTCLWIFVPTTARTGSQRYLVLSMTQKQKVSDGIDLFMRL
jgi:putative DNA primase/helicase